MDLIQRKGAETEEEEEEGSGIEGTCEKYR